MEFRILGPLEIWEDGRRLALAGAKPRALLAALLIQANHVVGVERLIESLWGEDPPETAGNVLQVYVSQLRKVLEHGGGQPSVLVSRPPGYLLQLEAGRLDAARFESLLERAIGSPPNEAAPILRQALALWRGPALAEFATEQFALTETARLEELRLRALEERIEADLALGRHAELIGELEGLVAEQPLRERLCGQLMQALYLCGRQAEASGVYQKTRRRLVEELGMEPGPQMQGLLKQILNQDPALETIGADGPGAIGTTSALPAGTVTFLMTDIEGSTRLWEKDAESMQRALARHDSLVKKHVGQSAGQLVEAGREGDSILAVFGRARDALECALSLQLAFVDEAWPTGAELRIRMALHSGEAELRVGHYYGIAVYRCARFLAAGHGGQILVSQATEELGRDLLREGAYLRELGLHRLKDLSRPEPVFQLMHPRLDSDFPALLTQDRPQTNLPLQLTRFVGRGREIKEVADLLHRSRLVTITGAGGIGKTRLALQVASRLVDSYRDGVWLVQLASFTDPALVAQAVMTVLDLRDQPGRLSLDTLVFSLGHRQALIVLDTCEHLIASVAPMVERLLLACPHLQVLATSREVLGIGGEVPWRVPSLTVPRLGALPPPEELVEYEAVALLADRASSMGGFRVTAETAPAVVEVCQRLDGIPLAIELAAARLNILSVTQVRDRLSDRFGLLTGANRAATPRQRTLRATIDWSYQLLSRPEQELLCRLSVFVGDCSFEAVEAVCVGEAVAHDSILDLLAGLVDKSLVMVEPSPTSHRYRLLDTIREFAREELSAAKHGYRVHDRHLDWCLALAVEAQPNLQGPDQLTWLNRIDNELGNIRAALDWGCRHQDPRALLLASKLHKFWNMRGYMREGYQTMRSVLSIGTEPTLDRAEALTQAGQLAGHSAGDHAGARELFLESLLIRERLGERRGLGYALMCLGGAEAALGNAAEARHRLDSAVAESRVEGDIWQLAMALNDCALYEHYLKAPGLEPREMLKESSVLLRNLRDDWSLGLILDSLAQVELDIGEVGEAGRLWIECVGIARRLDDKTIGAMAINGLGRMAAMKADYARALLLLSAAARLLPEAGKSLVPMEQTVIDAAIADARSALGQVEADATWAEGERMTMPRALDYALADGPD